MKKIAGALIAMTLILSACSVWTQDKVTNEIVQTNANYMVYDAQKVSDSDENKVLFFHASWCPDCVAANKSIAETSTTTWLKIFKIDFDDSVELRKKYGVTKQHTFVQIDSDGELIKKWWGTNTVEEISAEVVVTNEESEEENISDMSEEMENSEENSEVDVIENNQEVSEVSLEEEIDIQNDTQVEAEINDAEVTQNAEEAKNKYVEYSPEFIASNDEAKVLFFHAQWCPSCKAANLEFEWEDNTIGLDVVKVDYDEYDDLKSKYGVVSQHTFVLVDAQGNMLKRWYGSRNYADILTQLQS